VARAATEMPGGTIRLPNRRRTRENAQLLASLAIPVFAPKWAWVPDPQLSLIFADRVQ
jgi:hypothetical protein